MTPRYLGRPYYMLPGDVLIGQLDIYDFVKDPNGMVFIFWDRDAGHLANAASEAHPLIDQHILQYARALGNLAS